MSLRKILFQKPGNLREFISALKKEVPSKRKVTIYENFVDGKITINAIINSQRVFLAIYKTQFNSPYKSRQEELEARAKEYGSRLKQEGFHISFYE